SLAAIAATMTIATTMPNETISRRIRLIVHREASLDLQLIRSHFWIQLFHVSSILSRFALIQSELGLTTFLKVSGFVGIFARPSSLISLTASRLAGVTPNFSANFA